MTPKQPLRTQARGNVPPVSGRDINQRYYIMATKKTGTRVTGAKPKAAPKKAAFSFEGSIIEEAPYIESDSFEGLEVGVVLKGVVDYVEQYKGKVKAAVLINGHTTRVTLWDYTMEEAKRIIGDDIMLKFGGMNDAGYPKLYVRH